SQLLSPNGATCNSPAQRAGNSPNARPSPERAKYSRRLFRPFRAGGYSSRPPGALRRAVLYRPFGAEQLPKITENLDSTHRAETCQEENPRGHCSLSEKKPRRNEESEE